MAVTGSAVADMGMGWECTAFGVLLEGGRGEEWSQRVCVGSRRVHIAVWTLRPSANIVTTRVIPLLEAAKSAVEEAATPDSPTSVYARNVGIRIENLRRYARGLPSAIKPDDRLEDPAPLPALGKEGFEKLGLADVCMSVGLWESSPGSEPLAEGK